MPRRNRARAKHATVLVLLLFLGAVAPPGALGYKRDRSDGRGVEEPAVDPPNAGGRDQLLLVPSPPILPPDIGNEESDMAAAIDWVPEVNQRRGLRHHWSSSSSKYKRKKKYYSKSESKSKKKKKKKKNHSKSKSKSKKRKYKYSSSSSKSKKKKKYRKKEIFKKVKKYYYQKGSSSSSKYRKYKYKKSSSDSWW